LLQKSVKNGGSSDLSNYSFELTQEEINQLRIEYDNDPDVLKESKQDEKLA